MKKFDVIVIGSGIGGLVSAGILTARGLKVLVVEKNRTPGGYLSSFRRKGFVFDSAVDCISGVASGQLVHRVLEMLGVDSEVRFNRLDPIRVSLFPGLEIIVDADIKAYKERLASIFKPEATSLKNFFDEANILYARLKSSLTSVISGRLDLSAVSPETIRLMTMPYSELLDKYFADFRLKAVLSDRCPFIGLPPSGVSASSMLAMIMSYFDLGAYRVEGGFQVMADAFVRGIRKKGGETLFSDGVNQIYLNEKNLCSGLKCDSGREYTTRYVISNADFDFTFRSLLGGEYGKFADDMMRRSGISTSFFIVYAGVKGSPGRHSSLGWYPSYDMERYFDPDMEFREDSTIGITVASIEDQSRAPQGFSTVVLHEMATASCGGLDKSACTEKILQKAGRIFPDIRDRIVVLDSATPLTLQRYTANCRGAAFGWKRIPGFGGPGRFGIDNLHIAGHWGNIGGGVLAAAYSGAKAAGEILAKEGIIDGI
jgi:prolycopene isomerase